MNKSNNQDLFLQDELEVVRKIVWRRLDRKKYRAFIYGSRAKGTNFRWSDVDIGIEGKQAVPAGIFLDLEEDLWESDLPYAIELVDFYGANRAFVKRAKEVTIPLN